MLTTGRLKKLIKEDGISGITSNPAIFNKAMTQGDAYDDQLRKLAAEDITTERLYELMAIEDIRLAADQLRQTFEDSNGTDGFVSLEVNPHLAHDTEGTLRAARRLWDEVARPNLMIKIPGTPEGVPAIRDCLAAGINVNVTLLFSLEAYRAVMEAHLAALEIRHGARRVPGRGGHGGELLPEPHRHHGGPDAGRRRTSDEAAALRGTVAVASARLAYRMWKETYSGPRWEKLRDAGARVQKPLWASTSTKDKTFSDVKYVEALIGPQTINTLPDETMEAFRDHGTVAVTVEDDLDRQAAYLEGLEAIGISLKQVTDELVAEGIEKFNEPFDALLAALDEKRKRFAGASAARLADPPSAGAGAETGHLPAE